MRCPIGKGECLRQKKLIGYFESVLWISEEKQNEETITNKLGQNTEGRGFK